ncbi:hypothetical protein BC826DRAFT_906606 [Russula brevipes]|nr:hypothetical protein BC826DRAFT_906606 [Russula brevipes]
MFLVSDQLTLLFRYANRAHRFGDGYLRGLTGPQAAWAAKSYRGHRVFPETILDDLRLAGVY